MTNDIARALDEQGYVVVPGVVSREQAEEWLGQLWDVIEALGTVRRDDSESHKRGDNWPTSLHSGMYQYIGHLPCQRAARAQVAHVFAALFGTDDLQSSTDGFSLFSRARNMRVGPMDEYLHVDQAPAREGFWSYQGLLSLTDSEDGDGGFVVVPGSHKRRDLLEEFGCAAHKQNWWKFTDAQKKRIHEELSVIKVNCAACDMILWDSRCWHAPCRPDKQSPNLIRACMYICMLPTSMFTQKQLDKRAKYAKDLRCTSHHPRDGRIFPVLPRFFKCALQKEDAIRVIKEMSARE
jgi:ectoine hydroxylase-related dioxygenase (phytanoyl-CoA dioxygenase family)